MATYVPPKRATECIFYAGLVSQANTKIFQANPTIASGDFKVSIDGGALANLGTLPTVTPASGKMVKITLSIAEMTGDNITVVCSDASGAEWCDLVINIQTSTKQIDDLSTQFSQDIIDDFLDTEIAAIKAKTDNLPSDPADASDIATSFGGVNTKLDTIDDFLDTEMAATLAAVDTEVAAIKAVTDALPNAGALTTIQADLDNIQTRLPAALVGGRMDSSLAAAGLETDAVAEITAAIQALTLETGLTWQEALRLIAAACAGKASGLATATAVYRNAVADSKDRITATVDVDGNRTAITYDLT